MRTALGRTHLGMLCAVIMLATFLGSSRPAAAALGPISPSGHPIIFLGVVYHTEHADLEQDRRELQAIIDAFGGSAYRYGNVYDVQLVIETDISWNLTEPNQGDYHFERYQQFAEIIRSMNLAWTPLLSYHYAPDWVRNAYAADAMPSSFMPFVPTSGVWSGPASTWTRQAMQALSPYLGNPIKVVLCGNEMLTARRASDPSPPSAAYLDTRSRDWANALATLVNAAKGVVQGRAPVTTKLVPYELRATEMLQAGMFPHVYDLLDSLDVVAIDAYPPADTEFQSLFRSDKGLYLAEFNQQVGGASGNELLAWVQRGVSRYNLRYAAWYCWQCGPQFSMTADQQRGMRDAISWVTGLWSVYNQPSRGVAFQLSTNILNKADANWMVHPDEANRHGAVMGLGARLPVTVRYEVDYRPRTADVQMAQVVDSRSVSTFGRGAIYLLESTAARVSAAEGTFYTSGNGGNSDGTVVYSPSLAYGTRVFDWTPEWNVGVRRLEKSLPGGTGGYRDWVIAPDGAPQAGQLGKSFFLAQGTLYELWYHPERPLPTLLGDMINAAATAAASGCGEATCVPVQGMYVSHFSGPNCTGTESYYLPYDGYAYNCRTWNGTGQCGTIRRTVTNYSARINGGACQNLWPAGNTLTDFVTIYR